VVNDATKKFREPLAFALLAVSALWFIGAISLLFKSNALGLGFAARSAVIGGLFESPITVLSLVVAVVLVTGGDGPTPAARPVVLAALGIAGLDLLFGVITFFAQFGANEAFGYVGVAPAGKVVGAFLGLAALLFLAAATTYIALALRSLPAPATSPQWSGTPAGYAGYGASGQSWGQPAQGSAQPAQGSAQQAQGYSQHAQAGWGDAGQGYGQQPSTTGWGGPPPAPTAPAGWGAQGQPTGGWPAQNWEGAGGGTWPGAGAWPQPPAASGTGQPGAQGWQWAQETPPTGSEWIQPTPTYGDAPTSLVETPSDPVWSDSDYGEASRPGWADQQPQPVRSDASTPSDTDVEAHNEIGAESSAVSARESLAESEQTFSGSAGESAASTADVGEEPDAGGLTGVDSGTESDRGAADESDAGSGWWRPSQR
jgi:hypothetical protein